MGNRKEKKGKILKQVKDSLEDSKTLLLKVM